MTEQTYAEVEANISEVLMEMYDHGTNPNALREARYFLGRFRVIPRAAEEVRAIDTGTQVVHTE